jgi:two-component system response regulator PilR (NtrC family)
LTHAALVHLSQYPFPGNVRELENLLHRAVALSGGELIDVADLGLSDEVGAGGAPSGFGGLADACAAKSRSSVATGASMAPVDPAATELPHDLAFHLDEVERDILWRALERHRFNRTAAGASLGLSLRQMRYRMARLNVMSGADPQAPPGIDTDIERGSA